MYVCSIERKNFKEGRGNQFEKGFPRLKKLNYFPVQLTG